MKSCISKHIFGFISLAFLLTTIILSFVFNPIPFDYFEDFYTSIIIFGVTVTLLYLLQIIFHFAYKGNKKQVFDHLFFWSRLGTTAICMFIFFIFPSAVANWLKLYFVPSIIIMLEILLGLEAVFYFFGIKINKAKTKEVNQELNH